MNNVIMEGSANIALSIQRKSTNIRIAENEIEGNGGTDAAVRVMNYNGYAPNNIIIENNTIRAANGLAGTVRMRRTSR